MSDLPAVSESNPIAGLAITLGVTVRNQGTGPADPTTLRYYLSTDSTVTSEDTEVGSVPVPGLDPSATSAESMVTDTPSAPGTYHYGVCVDPVSGESDTTNNCSVAVAVTVLPPPPDLVPDLPAVSESNPIEGQAITLEVTVRNQGAGPSDPTTLRYYRSIDSTVTSEDTEVGSDHVAGLEMAGISGESILTDAPSAPGTYYYGACVDPVSGESDTTNNCSVAVAVTVLPPPPDLVSDLPAVSESNPIAGQAITLEVTVRNQGAGPADPTTLRYYLSIDSTVTSEDTEVGSVPVPGLDPSATSAESMVTDAPSAPGTYYYGACVDPASRESDMANNCSDAVAVTVLPPPPQTELLPPPDALGLDSFYQKYLDLGGLPIVSSLQPQDDALFRARDIISDMLAHRPDLLATIVDSGIRIAIMARSEVTTDIPEHSDLYEAFPGTDWNTRARGLSATLSRPATSAAEENLLCYEGDAYWNEDILVREFARTVLQMGVERQSGGVDFRTRLEVAYRDAIDAGLWAETYAASNADEYWAEAVQSWFGLNDTSAQADGVHNQIDTRHELEAYDPVIASLIQEVFGETTVSSTCHTVAVSADVGEQETFEFLGDVLAAKQAEIRALAADIRNVFDPYASGKSLPVSLVVSYDQALLKERFREVAGYEYPGDICGVREDSLFVFLELPCGRPGVFAHEYFHHFLQEATAPSALTPDYGPGYSAHGPWWLTEGAAVYGEKLYVVPSGIASYDDERDREINGAKYSTRRLAELETHEYFFENTDATYALGFLAVEWLVQHSSEGALLEYYELLLEHDTWQAAFESAFGLAVDEFYEAFEEHRSEILPNAYRIAGVVLGPDGQPLEGVGIWAWHAKRENSRFERTGPAGSFSVAVLEGSFTLLIYAVIEPDCSFVGWYDGVGGLATERSLAATVVVDNAGVEGIEINLPDYPDRLPFIEWCAPL